MSVTEHRKPFHSYVDCSKWIMEHKEINVVEIINTPNGCDVIFIIIESVDKIKQCIETSINHLLFNSGYEIYDLGTNEVVRCGFIGVRKIKDE